MDIIKELTDLNVGQVLKDVNIKEYTTYKAGGIGRVLVIPKDIESLQKNTTESYKDILTIHLHFVD